MGRRGAAVPRYTRNRAEILTESFKRTCPTLQISSTTDVDAWRLANAGTVADAPPFAAAAILGVGGPAARAVPAPLPATAAAEVLRAVATWPAPPRSETDARRIAVVDGVVFQRVPSGGIARVWRELLPRLAANLNKKGWRLRVLRRAGSALPSLPPDVDVRDVGPFPEDHDHAADALALSLACRDADAFASTEYAHPHAHWRGRFALVVHDLTPERFGWPVDACGCRAETDLPVLDTVCRNATSFVRG